MTWFSHRVRSTEVVDAPRSAIWEILSNPDTLAGMVARVSHIEDHGAHWRWYLQGVSALGVTLEPSFTERMEFTPEGSIVYTHDPQGRHERAGADGRYDLEEVEGGTRVSIDITLKVDLPLPRAMRGAVEKVMAREMDRTGHQFAANLDRAVRAR